MYPVFDPGCRRCPRLAAFMEEVKAENPTYHCRPVPAFGDSRARLLIVGLAPGKHGANASGRPFTGDFAGIILYRTLHRFGFADRPDSLSALDGLHLRNCRITNAVKCLPPENKPNGLETRNCNHFLAAELASLPTDAVVLALGGLAHRAIIRACERRASQFSFGHGAEHDLGSIRLLDSYHCSRYNTQTRRLTEAMFDRIVERAKTLLG